MGKTFRTHPPKLRIGWWSLNTSENVAPLTPRFWEWLKAKPENRLDYSDLERIRRGVIRHYRSHGQPLSFNARGDAELLGQRSAEVRKPQWDDDTAWPTPTIVSPITARWAWARPVRAGCVALLVAALVVAILPRFAQQMGFREGCPTLREQHQTGCRLSRGSFSNDSGDSSTLELVDGSEIVLHGNTQVTLDMSPLHRHIRLDRGTALFKVHKDSAAVFGVHVGDATVTAVGTIFSVGNKGQNGARVAVLEGAVRIEAKNAQPLIVPAGGIANVTTQGIDIYMRGLGSAYDDEGLTRTNKLVPLNGMTLSEAANELNRYNSRKIEVAPDIAQRRFAGQFEMNNPDIFAESLQVFGIEHSISRDALTGIETIHLKSRSAHRRAQSTPGKRNDLAEQP